MLNKTVKKAAKADTVQLILAIIGGGFAFINYLMYWINGGASTLPLPPLVMLCVLIPPVLCLLFGKKFSEKFPRMYRALKWCYTFIGLFYTVTFIAFSAFISSGVSAEADADIYIVLGCRTRGYEPSFALNLRLELAADLLTGHPDAVAVLSGGQGEDEGISEAESMRAYLVSHGIDGSRLILEDKSTSTVENLNFSMKILSDKNLANKKISVVTSDFHAKRVARVADSLNYSVNVVGAETPICFKLYTNLIREYMAWIRNGVY